MDNETKDEIMEELWRIKDKLSSSCNNNIDKIVKTTNKIAEEFLTLKYMTRFSCIGSECEDHCCHSWTVYVDEDHYKKLKKRMSTTKAESDKFQASVERPPPPRI